VTPQQLGALSGEIVTPEIMDALTLFADLAA
jgi:hypothetical protein